MVGSQSLGASGLYIDHDSYNNQFFGNTFESNFYDIYLAPYSHNNNLSGNSINSGVYINNSPDNLFLHNNLITRFQISFTGNPSNMWDNDFEGNYWRLYNGTDSNGDGIGDVPYIIDSNNTDYYPLMGMFHSFNTSLGKRVDIISNSSFGGFEYESPSTIQFSVSNVTESQTHGFCRVAIPYTVVSPPYNVTINGADPTYWNYTLYDNGTHQWIYFEFEHSTKEVVIIPEFPSIVILPLFMTTTLLAALLRRRKGKSTCPNQ